MTTPPDMPKDVRHAFDALPEAKRATLLDVRALVFETAASTPGVGPIEEALRWGEPAYLTSQSRSGSTIRLGIEKASGHPAMFFNCQTRLVEDFRQQFGDRFSFSKNRAVLLDPDRPMDTGAVSSCLAAALTYHRKR